MRKSDGSINWAGIAAFVAALAAVPGILVNTYLDYKGRTTTELVQKSSYDNMSDSIVDLGDDVDECLDGLSDLNKEMAKLRGYVDGISASKGGRVRRSPVLLPEPSSQDPSAEAVADGESTPKKRRITIKFDDIMRYVQTTGEVYKAKDQEGN